jgi:hypothetical protein
MLQYVTLCTVTLRKVTILARWSAAQRIVDWFCEGSVETLLAGMVDSAVLDRKELQRLADRIAASKKGKKS